MRSALAIPIAFLVLFSFGHARSAVAQNIVLLIADDMGVDASSTYGESSTTAPTPGIDSLASQGVLFRNAWAEPTCSPFRAAVLTGRNPSATGVGWGINGNDDDRDLLLPDDPSNLPRLLAASGYRTVAIGKWHLGAGLGITLSDLFDDVVGLTESHPLDVGFGHYEGYLFSGTDYYDWPKTTNGVTAYSTAYATTDEANAAIEHLQGAEPFLLWVGFRAPHAPLQVPPLHLLADPDLYGGFASNDQIFRAMIEALDSEIRRVLDAVDMMDTTVIFVADNGTLGALLDESIPVSHGKRSVYEGGVNVPLIVAGQAVAATAAGRESTALVQATDLFMTILEMAGVDPPLRSDAVSFAAQLADPAAPPPRQVVFAEGFIPNGGPIDPIEHLRAVREDRYKLVRRGLLEDELYDLQLDPTEQSPLPMSDLTPEQVDVYAMLRLALAERATDAPALPALAWGVVPMIVTIVVAGALAAGSLNRRP
jgi:arylsulfatase A-like enzyme